MVLSIFHESLIGLQYCVMKGPMLRLNRPLVPYFAFKIKDGLFIGDGQSPNQLDFLMANKITTIINCAASEVCVSQQPEHLRVVNFEWLDNDEEVILDPADSNFQSICYFIDDAHSKFEGVLVCSLRGQSRALTVITAYLIKKYRWSLYKTLEYLNSKRSDFEIRANFLKQLLDLEVRLFGKKLKNCTKNWEEEELDRDGLIVKNTYINSLMGKEGKDKRPTSKAKRNSVSRGRSVKFHETAIVINNQPKTEEVVEEIIDQQKTYPSPKNAQIKQAQPELNILELNKVIERHLIKKQQTPRRAVPQRQTIHRSKTEMEEPEIYQLQPAKFANSSNIKPLNRREKIMLTPYRLRRGSDKSEKLITEPQKEDVQFNISLNINSINIIQAKGNSHRKSKLLNQQKLKMYLNNNLANVARRKKEGSSRELQNSRDSRRVRSSSSKRLSADITHQSRAAQQQSYLPPRRKLSFVQSVYSNKPWS